MSTLASSRRPDTASWCRRSLLTRVAGLALAAAATLAPAHAEDWAPNFTGRAVWNSNASNADASSDQLDTLIFNTDILAGKRYGLARADALVITGHLGGEWWPRYNSMAAGSVGARAEWQHKFGLGALAPVLSLELAADGVVMREPGRDGTRLGAVLALRKRLNDALRVTLSHEFAEDDAEYSVFDRTGNETRIEVDRDLGPVSRLTLGIGYRRGDILSYATPPRPDLVAVAQERLEVETFDRPMMAYSIDARTWSARASLSRALDENSAIVASYEWRDSRRAPLKYTNHLVSIALVHQF